MDRFNEIMELIKNSKGILSVSNEALYKRLINSLKDSEYKKHYDSLKGLITKGQKKNLNITSADGNVIKLKAEDVVEDEGIVDTEKEVGESDEEKAEKEKSKKKKEDADTDDLKNDVKEVKSVLETLTETLKQVQEGQKKFESFQTSQKSLADQVAALTKSVDFVKAKQKELQDEVILSKGMKGSDKDDSDDEDKGEQKEDIWKSIFTGSPIEKKFVERNPEGKW